MAKKPNIYDVVRHASMTLVTLQRSLHDAGLHATAKAVNEASQKLGWEASAKLASTADSGTSHG